MYMKKITSLTLLLLLSINLLAQELCKREFLTKDSLEFKTLVEFEGISLKEGYFINGKGVYEITRYKDKDGNKTWWMSVCVEDSFKDNLPDAYAYFGSNVVLIYEGDSQGNRKPTIGNVNKREYLEQIIQDRLYIRPPYQDKIIVYDGLDGRPLGKEPNGNFIKRSVNNYKKTGGGPGRLVKFNIKSYEMIQLY